ncbi:MAG: helix-turn-helix domain-containing protein [Pseudomonadota bacterium]|nr:helix-turn-helix domain-containing protein [Pseudomonadota bacterium]
MAKLPIPDDATYLSVNEIAALLRFHPKTIRRWITKGELPATQLGRDWRIKHSDLKACLAAKGNRVEGHVL